MKRREISLVPIVASQVLAALLFVVMSTPAQQGIRSQPIRQEVPDNPLRPAPPAQPLPYSHKTHLALGLNCQFCHINPDPGEKMAFPATSKCMGCHATIAKNKPAIRQLAQFAKSNEPIRWVHVYAVLSGVKWTHRKHLEAGVKCETCHGQVSQMDAIAEVTSVTTMASCIHCHELHNAKSACVTCHLWPPAGGTR